jgi:hypothetical protein
MGVGRNLGETVRIVPAAEPPASPAPIPPE